MRRALLNSPLGSGQAPARFSLLETIASAEERGLLCLERQRRQVDLASYRAGRQQDDCESRSFLRQLATRTKEILLHGISRMSRMNCCGLSFKGRERQMHIIEQLAVGRTTTLVLLEVAGERLLLSVQSGAATTVTPLSSLDAARESNRSGPQRVESQR